MHPVPATSVVSADTFIPFNLSSMCTSLDGVDFDFDSRWGLVAGSIGKDVTMHHSKEAGSSGAGADEESSSSSAGSTAYCVVL